MRRPGLKAFLKHVVSGTPLEPYARAVWKAIRQKTRDDVYNDLTLAILRRILRPDSNCVDVGCFEGVVLDEILGLAPEGTHYAFEPLPHLYAALRKKYLGRRNTVVCELALSNAAGQAPFQYNLDHPGYSGLLRREYPSPNDRLEPILVRSLGAGITRGIEGTLKELGAKVSENESNPQRLITALNPSFSSLRLARRADSASG